MSICIFVALATPHTQPSPAQPAFEFGQRRVVCLLSVARSLNVATSSKIRRACPLPRLDSMRHADLALISRDFNESRLTSQKAKPEPCNLRPAPCTLNPDSLLMTSLIRAARCGPRRDTCSCNMMSTPRLIVPLVAPPVNNNENSCHVLPTWDLLLLLLSLSYAFTCVAKVFGPATVSLTIYV